jgi:hypothetical protein
VHPSYRLRIPDKMMQNTLKNQNRTLGGLLASGYSSLGHMRCRSRAIAVNMLPSGDIDLYFENESAKGLFERESADFLSRLGGGTMIIKDIYSIIVHGIRTRSIDITPEGKRETIKKLLLDNYTHLPEANIYYISWLAKLRSRTPSKERTSLVLGFTHLEDANIAIRRGVI